MDHQGIEPAAMDVLAAVLAAQPDGDEASDETRTLRLPEGCDRAALVGSLREAMAALQERERQRERRGRLPANVGKPWTAEQDAALLAAFDAGLPLDTIAAQLQRTRVGVRTRLERHGRLTPAPA
jgi:hypothetical protein